MMKLWQGIVINVNATRSFVEQGNAQQDPYKVN